MTGDGGGSRRSSGLRPSLFLVPLGVIGYGVYVAGGLLFGLALLSAALRQSPSVSIPLVGPAFALPRIALPLLGGSPLALIPDWAGTERVNVLILGVDQREDERDIGLPTRSDTLMVLSVDPVQKTAAAISFPRDLWVSIPGFAEERINAAYRLGELRRVEGGGAALASQTVERNFGVRSPYYVMVDFRGFEEIIDTLGGIVIDVPRPIKDDEYPTSDYGFERVYFAPGPQLMDGSSALKYARTRHADSDFARMARQQQILLALRDRGLRLNVLPQLPTLVDKGVRAIQTNLSPTELLSLAKLGSEIPLEAVTTLVVERELVTPFSGIGGASLLLPNRTAIQKAIQRTMADPRMVAEGARLEIVATPALSSIARQAGDRLAAQGLQNLRQTTARGPEQETTVVLASGDKPRSVAALLRTLGLGSEAITPFGALEGNVDIRIVLGRDLQL